MQLVVNTHLEDYIYHLYKKMEINNPEKIDMHLIAEKLNIRIVYGSTVFCYRNYIMLKHSCARQQWQSFGHELAHVLLHSGNQMDMYPMYREYQEWRADLFALHFCIPTFMLEKLNLPSTRNEAISMIANEFGVSLKFAEVRLDKWLNKNKLIDIKTLTNNY